ncbi:MAG: Lrp/AsnC family transcriptional regulator [Candidatus Heimdallarchaeota archaeon]|nr:Lrp/AsnC family transcriptional regulator [Candidatus Heimdallarchaeota archaeon]MDH5645568.1 Lrp/AsnC family transcriptional regulator [Candidatus Heimdallarchaeota archaeon]
MDHIDLAILHQLMKNCRVTNREIANVTNLSVSAVHKRIKALEEENVIIDYTARPSITALNCIPVVIIGKSRSDSMEEIKNKIGNHENVFALSIASGNYLYISILLRNLSELRDAVTTITILGDIDEPIVGIVNEGFKTQSKRFSEIERKILKTISRNGKKSYTDISQEIGSSVKTVKRIIERMIEDDSVTFTIEWAPLYRESFVSVIHININTGDNILEIQKDIFEKFNKNIIISAIFSNIPNFILLEIWTQTPSENQLIIEKLQEQDYKNVTPHILLSISWYKCWVDNLFYIE